MRVFRRNPIKKVGIQYSKTSEMLYNASVSHNREKHWIPHFMNFTLIYWIFKDCAFLNLCKFHISIPTYFGDLFNLRMLLMPCKDLAVTSHLHSVSQSHCWSLCAETKAGYKGQGMYSKCLPVAPKHIQTLKIHSSWRRPFTKCSGMAPVDVSLQAPFLYTQITQVGVNYLL